MPICARCGGEKPHASFPPIRAQVYPGWCRRCAGERRLVAVLAAAGIPPGEALTIPEAAASTGTLPRVLGHAAARHRLRTVRAGSVRYTSARWVASWRAAWLDDGS